MNDIVFIIGLVATCYGLYLYDPRLPFVVGGGIMILLSVIGSLKPNKDKK